MKKLIPALLLFVLSFFAVQGVQASATQPVTEKATAKVKPVFSGHWEYWCVYNEKTHQFEIIAVWVEDDI